MTQLEVEAILETKREILKVSSNWTICNFKDINNEVLVSPQFGMYLPNEDNRDSEKILWKLEFNYPSKALTVRLLNTSLPQTVTADVQVKIIGENDEEFFQKKSSTVYAGNTPNLKISSIFESFCGDILEEPSTYFPNGNLEIRCEIEFPYFCCKSSEIKTFDLTECKSKAIKDFASLYGDDSLADITFVADEKEIMVHKAILSARSCVFAAMFKDKFQEQIDKKVLIRDMSFAVLLELLRFIYTGEVENLGEIAPDLLPAADKYNLLDLKEICAKSLLINIDYVCATLALADLHNIKDVKQKCLQFIVENPNAVMEGKEWNQLVDSHPKLVSEAFRLVVNNK